VIDVRCPLSHLAEEAARVFTGMFNAAMYFDLHQVPELFCGFPGDEGEAHLPVACTPQAWPAASAFLLFQACLGLSIQRDRFQNFFCAPFAPTVLE
jgi:glycogen debranching enzyme